MDPFVFDLESREALGAEVTRAPIIVAEAANHYAVARTVDEATVAEIDADV